MKRLVIALFMVVAILAAGQSHAFMAMGHMPNQTGHHDMIIDAGVDDASSCDGMCLAPEKYSCCGEVTSHCATAFVGTDLAFKMRDLNSNALRLGRRVAQLQARISSFEPPPPKS